MVSIKTPNVRAKAYRNMVGNMLQSNQEYAAGPHISAACGFEFVDAPLGFMLDSSIQRGFFRHLGPVRMNRNSADKALIV
jgi:hypothetical protein